MPVSNRAGAAATVEHPVHLEQHIARAACSPAQPHADAVGRRPRPRRMVRMLTAALVAGATAAALPGAATASTAQSASTKAASAAAWSCGAGNFCLYEYHGGQGADYFHSGNDGNLNNDYFRAGVRVGNNASSSFNNGVAHAYDDVVVYNGMWSVGPLACIPRGYVGEHYGSHDNAIESFAWVTGC